jgi:N-carbamoyl-L-amino-acid hydrolase
MSVHPTLNPQRTVDELKELRALTGDENGAQRVAFTPVWDRALEWFKEKLAALPVTVETDEAYNIWATLPGASDRELIIGGHLDSVPNGGWLDGCLNVLAGLEVLRAFAAAGTPPVTIRLVNWADEEGARWGRSLFGSSAVSGKLVPDDARPLVDKDGHKLVDVLAQYGITLEGALAAQRQVKNAAAYLELHIEQGPVLLDRGEGLGAVIGTCGVERHAIRFTGQAAHSGSTPMNRRRDALGAAAKFHLAIREIAVREGGVSTVGRLVTLPGIVSSVVAQADLTLDQRHIDANALARMYADARAASERFAHEENVGLAWSYIWDIEPILFHETLVDFCAQAIEETTGIAKAHRLPSGPLHDAAEMARIGIPTVMMFTQSLHGISHNKIEDTLEEHLLQSVEALDRLAIKTADWIVAGGA